MTLREIIKENPDLFYSQSWYEDEPFMDTPMPTNMMGGKSPDSLAYPGTVPENIGIPIALGELVPASWLARQYVQDPKNPIWDNYLWTSDKDRLGQRVYVGDNGKGLEIHRHLAITDRWGVPRWEDE